MLRKAADRLLRGLRAYRANRHARETPADPNDPLQLQRGMALLSFVVIPVLLVMAVLNVLEVPVVIDVLTLALALLVVATCWWVFDVPTPHRSRAGAMTVLIGAIVLLAAMAYAEFPSSASTPFWMGLVILAAATILGVRAAVLVTGFAIATVAAVYLVAAIVAPFAPPLIEALAAARRMFFLAAILAMGIVARRLTDRQLVAVHTQRETIEHQAAALTTEVAERRRAQEELAHSLGEVISEATDGVINYQPDGRIIDANQSAADMLGCDLGALRGRRLTELLSPSRAEAGEAPDDLLARLTRPGARVELLVGSDPRTARRTEWAASARQSTERTVFMAIVRDVTERKRFEARLYRQANYDALTGLPKRHFLAQTLDNLLAVEEADPDLMAVLALRVDGFRTVRDGLGFEFGQEILRVTAKRLNRLLEPGDLAAFSDIAFLILIRESSDRDQTQDLVRRLQTVIAEPIGFAGKQVTLTASVGICTTVRGQHADESLRDAGAALNRARQRGPGQIQFYDDEFRATALQQLDIDSALRTALRRDEFRLLYQPIVSAATGQVLGAEALLRWQREGVGLVPPAAFLQRLEATGLINDVGNWVIREACRQLAEWQQRIRGADAHRQLPFMHINVSPLQFAGAELRSTVVRAIRTHGLEPYDVVLEITESAAFDPRFGITQTLRGMREFGIRMAIDDFGTGFSSLSQLRHVHADVLKLDKTFIDHLAHSQRDRAIVAAIITVAQELGLVLVAEGVETPEQHAWLRRMGCQQAQGYLFARPAPPDVSLTFPSAREPEPTPDSLPAGASTPSGTEVSP